MVIKSKIKKMTMIGVEVVNAYVHNYSMPQCSKILNPEKFFHRNPPLDKELIMGYILINAPAGPLSGFA